MKIQTIQSKEDAKKIFASLFTRGYKTLSGKNKFDWKMMAEINKTEYPLKLVLKVKNRIFYVIDKEGIASVKRGDYDKILNAVILEKIKNAHSVQEIQDE